MSTIVTQPASTQRHGTTRTQRAQRTSRTKRTQTAAAPHFDTHRLTRSFPAQLAAPGAGVLHLWRFRASWLPVPIHESEQWLSDAERHRARLHPNAAQRHRYIASRVMLRWIGANLSGQAPRDVVIAEGYGEQRGARLTVGDQHLSVDIAFGGIWVLIAIAQPALALGIAMPRPGGEAADIIEAGSTQRRARANVWDVMRARARRSQEGASQRRAARMTSLAGALQRADRTSPVDELDTLDALDPLHDDGPALWLDLADAGRWHVIDLPMPGEIRGAISVAQRIEQIHAVGWFGP
ncbi:hypothetical protein [Paraburkholderia sp. J94]|uniref:hypothetical protein n=1 Tax=Paraburkholderia sp. J94 TaxID=2805441 RepID=UPI002AAF2451|nr:hypothetical protein [Paraburkholderia sp. J94]